MDRNDHDYGHRAPGARLARGWWSGLAGLLTLTLAIAAPLGSASAQDEGSDDFFEMDLEDLGSLDIEVTSVSKKEQKISESPAAIAVITGEDIRRAGHTTIPEALRMIPGMDVRRLNGSSWSISARGFSSDFSNKLLVMIDGRSVYTPLFGGVYWDEKDVMIEDIDRIEVIRGPGGTIWGANAVNGVINIITKRSDKTHGVLASVLAGPPETDSRQEIVTGVARYGGSVGDLHYRVYGKYFDRPSYDLPGGVPGGAPTVGHKGNEDWWQTRGGFRADYLPEVGGTKGYVTGDFYYGKLQDAGVTIIGITPSPIDNDTDLLGAHVLGNASHDFANGQNVTFQTYWDLTSRNTGLLGERRNTVDIDAQHSFSLFDGMVNNIWGLSYRYTNSQIFNISQIISLSPVRRTDHLVSGFFQTEIEPIKDFLRITLGTKVENNEYTGWEFQPSGRISIFPNERTTLWGSVSRAVRTPTQVDDDIFIALFQSPSPDPLNPGSALIPVINGNHEFSSEKLMAYELGGRYQASKALNFDLAFFLNRYDALSALTSSGLRIPVGAGLFVDPFARFTNEGDGWTWGAEFLVNWRVNDWLRYTAAYSYIDMDTSLGHGPGRAITSDTQDEQTPNHIFHIRQLVNLPYHVEWDTMVYFWDQADDSNPLVRRIDQTLRLDLRLGYRPVEWLDVSFLAMNLTDHPRQEAGGAFGVPGETPRSFHLKATVAF